MPYTPGPDLAAFLQSLPKTETHLHLEGALPFELLQAAFPGRHPAPPPSWADDFRYDSFNQFMDQYVQWCADFFVSVERYHECARIVLGNCARQNVRYVETSWHLPVAAATGLDPRAILRAIHAAAPPGLDLRVFVGMSHNDYAGAAKELIDDAPNWSGLTGLDLHGWEDLPLEPWTAEVWARARAAGKFNKAHAGEFMPADYVARTLDELQVTRIQHGNGAAEDPALVARLVREGIGLDMCPISNLKLRARGLRSLREHPIRRLFDAGVRVTVNSDDPFFFGNSLTEDYTALVAGVGFSRREVVQVARNGWELALLPPEMKAPHLAELARIEGGLG
jgi:adenosine deaminase